MCFLGIVHETSANSKLHVTWIRPLGWRSQVFVWAPLFAERRGLLLRAGHHTANIEIPTLVKQQMVESWPEEAYSRVRCDGLLPATVIFVQLFHVFTGLFLEPLRPYEHMLFSVWQQRVAWWATAFITEASSFGQTGSWIDWQTV